MFKDRFDAAEQLVPLLKQYQSHAQAVILAIPRGGLELGYVLAKKLHIPLDVIFTKKIGMPLNPEYAIGAVSEKHVVLDEQYKHMPELQDYIAQETEAIRAVIRERNQTYRKNMQPLQLKDKIVIVVDDGVATGKTLLLTLALIKEYHPKKIVVALPVAPQDTLKKIQQEADEVICLATPEPFYSVGQFYINFDQVDDAQALRLLREAHQ